MPETRRVQLDWTKLFAFEQVEAERRDAPAVTGIRRRLGAKVGEKPGLKIDSRLGAKIGDKAGLKDDAAR